MLIWKIYLPANLSNLKSKLAKLDVNKLVPVPIDLNKLCHIVKNDFVKKDVYNAEIKNIKNKKCDITNLATDTTLNAKINEVKKEIPITTNLDTTASLTAVENKKPVSDLVKKFGYYTQLLKLKIKLQLIMIMINILLLKNLIS